MRRRNFLTKLGLVTGAVSIGAVPAKPQHTCGNHHTVQWFNDKGEIIKTEKYVRLVGTLKI